MVNPIQILNQVMAAEARGDLHLDQPVVMKGDHDDLLPASSEDKN